MTPPNRYDTRQLAVDEIVELTEADRQRTVRASPRGRAEPDTNPEQLVGEPQLAVSRQLKQLREDVAGGFGGLHTRMDNFEQRVEASLAPIRRRQERQGRWIAAVFALAVAGLLVGVVVLVVWIVVMRDALAVVAGR